MLASCCQPAAFLALRNPIITACRLLALPALRVLWCLQGGGEEGDAAGSSGDNDEEDDEDDEEDDKGNDTGE
jgi:hypothetical protein